MTRVARSYGYGDVNVLRIKHIDLPDPTGNDVQILVKAIGIDQAEVLFCNHDHLQEATSPKANCGSHDAYNPLHAALTAFHDDRVPVSHGTDNRLRSRDE